jgi:hypothetical protein
VSKGSVASGRVGVWTYGRAGVWAYRRDEWVSSGVRTAEWADVGRGAATDGIRLLPQARNYGATGLNGTDAVYGTGSHHGLASEARSRPPVTPISPRYRRPEHRWSG